MKSHAIACQAGGMSVAYLLAGAAGAGVAAAVWPFVAAFLLFLTCFLVVVAFVAELAAGAVDA